MKMRGLIAYLAGVALFSMAAPASAASSRPEPDFPLDTCAKYYPAAAAKDHAQGESTLFFRIAPDGKTADISLEQSSGNAMLDDAALTCARGLRYRVKSAVNWNWRVRIAFRLGPNGAESLVYVPHTCEQYYPPKELADGVKGTTRLSFTVRTDGGVEDVKVAAGSGNDTLDNAAAECATHWHYLPKTVDGTPVASPWQADVVWQPPSAPPE